MKRGEPLKRRPLRADPEKVREFMQRGRGKLDARSELKRQRRERPREGPLTPAEWRRQVFVLSEGRCIITGDVARDAEDRRFHAHHPLPKRELRARGLYGCVWDPRNGAWLRVDVHERHESPGVGSSRVPRSALPGSVWDFCAELDAIAGTEWATSLVRRLHPAR